MLPAKFSTVRARLTESKKFAFGFWFAIGTLLWLIDFVSKQIAHNYNWPIYQNTQLVFSIAAPPLLIFGLYLLVLGLIVHFVRKQFWQSSLFTQLAWVLIISGGLGNIVERLWRGFVTDFIFVFNGVFNLADVFIVIGLLILWLGKNEQ